MIINCSVAEQKQIDKVKLLIKTIPDSLKPGIGIPDIHITNSLFHSFCLMYHKYPPAGTQREEDFFDFCRKQRVWAFSCMPTGDRGDVYLALKERLERENMLFSVEHTIFHEIGHFFYYERGVLIKGDIDLDHETMSDIYANACILNLYNSTKSKGVFSKFKDESLSIMDIVIKKYKGKALLEVAELVKRKYGVL